MKHITQLLDEKKSIELRIKYLLSKGRLSEYEKIVLEELQIRLDYINRLIEKY